MLSFLLLTLDPAPSGTMSINSGDVETVSHDVTLQLNITNATEMRFSNDGTTWSAWEPYVDTKAWTMAGHGIRHVYGEFRSQGGNVFSASDSIRQFVEEIITASDGEAEDCFGGFFVNGIHGSQLAVSSDGDTVVVGSWWDDVDTNTDQGSAYVFTWNGTGWDEEHLVSTLGAANNGFGFSVSTTPTGNRVLIGSFYNNATGAVDVYTRDGSSWDEYRIGSMIGAGDCGYGVAVSISDDGNSALAGAYRPGEHSVYYYKNEGADWNETKFIGPEVSGYGFHVDISSDGNSFVVGYYGNSIYIYQWDGDSWNETQLLPVAAGAAAFGRIVSMSSDGTVVATGAYLSTITASQQGAVYVYRWSGTAWEEKHLYAADGHAQDYFGYSASLSGDGNELIVGCPSDDIDGKVDQGSAYRYRWDGADWVLVQKMTASDGAQLDYYGYTTFISPVNKTIGVGAPARNSRRGAVYLY